MTMRHLYIFVLIAFLFMLVACSKSSKHVEELKRFPIDSMEGIITRSGVGIDKDISSDGNGSLRITSTKPTVVRLFEVSDIGVENARLIYQARLRTENVEGKVYLEMWCRCPGSGEFFSRALHSPISGSTEWISQETPFFLEKNQKPDLVKLNLVIDGTGTVWMDEVKLLRSAR